MNKRKLFKILTSSLFIFNLISTSVFANTTNYGISSSVYPEMCNSSYWISKIDEPNKIIMNSSDIVNFNNNIINTSEQIWQILNVLMKNFNGVEFVNNLSNFTLKTTHFT